MMKDQASKAREFAALHKAPGCFVIPNPWDAGSARILAALGFKALTTTSAGFARSTGVADYGVTREQVLSHCREMVAATDLPVAGDLEDGFGPRPEDCAETIRLAAEAGLVGGSIEDATGNAGAPIHEIGLAADRIRAASEAARALSFPFMLVARCENHLHGRGDLSDTIARLQAYQEAGADVMFAPGLSTAADIALVCRSLDRPVNVMRGPRDAMLTLDELAALGVKRVSTGNLLHSAAMTAFIGAAREMARGGFGFSGALLPGAEIDGLLRAGTPSHQTE
ncbi:MAG: isocitrate lyase/PEP mutase family protein [Asticcacaulis sp.]